MKSLIRVVVVALAIVLPASMARADVYLSPFAGVNFGGDAGGEFLDEVDSRDRIGWGFAVGGMRAGVFGGEIDLGDTPNFFGSAPNNENALLTVMPSAIIAIPIGGQRGPGIRPYATAGIGMIRRRIEVGGVELLDDMDAAYSLGFGVMGFFTTAIGIRADYRYYRNFSSDLLDLGNLEIRRGAFDFSRASAGLVFRF